MSRDRLLVIDADLPKRLAPTLSSRNRNAISAASIGLSHNIKDPELLRALAAKYNGVRESGPGHWRRQHAGRTRRSHPRDQRDHCDDPSRAPRRHDAACLAHRRGSSVGSLDAGTDASDRPALCAVRLKRLDASTTSISPDRSTRVVAVDPERSSAEPGRAERRTDHGSPSRTGSRASTNFASKVQRRPDRAIASHRRRHSGGDRIRTPPLVRGRREPLGLGTPVCRCWRRAAGP